MGNITPQQARAELARRELERRQTERATTQMQEEQPQQEATAGFGDSLQDRIQSIMGMIPKALQASAKQITPSGTESAVQGLSEGIPQGFLTGARGLTQLAGVAQPPEMNLESPQNITQALGRGVGNMASLGALGAPLVAGGEAAIPGLLGASLGAGGAGAALEEGSMKDRLISGLMSAFIPSLAKGVSAAGRLGVAAIKNPTPRHAADILQEAEKVSLKQASDPFKKASAEAEKRGVTAIGVDKDIIQFSRKALADTQANKKLIREAKEGNYESLRDLQSDLGKRARKIIAKKDPTNAELNFAEEMEEYRNKINTSIYDHFEQTGNKDLADMVKEGMNKYRQHMELYYKKPQIAKLVGEDEEVSDNLLKTLKKDSKYYKKLRAAHPELDKVLQTTEDKEFLNKLYKKALGLGAVGAVGKVLLPNHQSSGSHE